MKSLNRFVFAETDPRIYAALRIIFASLALILMLDFAPVLNLHFSSQGWLPEEFAVASTRSLGWSPLFSLASPAAVWAYYAVGMAFIAAFAAGLKTRFSGIAAIFFIASFRDRNAFLFDGDDEYVRMIMLLLALAPSGLAWSLDARKKPETGQKAPGWPLRLLQFQLISSYLCNGVSKLQGTNWQDGSAIILAVTNPAYGRFDFIHTPMPVHLETLLKAVGCGIPYLEIAIAVFFCIPRLQKIGILMGIFLHLGIEAFIKLRFFPWIMLSWYLVFAHEKFMTKIEIFFRQTKAFALVPRLSKRGH